MPHFNDTILKPGDTVQVTSFSYPARRDIQYYRGDNLSFRIQFSDSGGGRFDLSQVDSFLCRMKVVLQSSKAIVDLKASDFVLESSLSDSVMDVLHVLHKGGLQFRGIALSELYYDVQYRMTTNVWTAVRGICYIEKDASAEAVEEIIPDPVSILNVDAGASTASVTHTEQTDATFYQYRLDGGDPQPTGLTNPFTIFSLTPEQSYSVQVRSGNDAGVSEWSDPWDFTTDALSPPAGAPAITGVSTTPDSGEVTYSGTSGATGYNYRLNSGSPVDIGTTNPFTISGLASDTPYQVEMQGYNAAGTGPWSDPFNFQTDEPVLNPPTSAPTIGDINVTDTEAEVFFSGVSGATFYEYRLDGGAPVNAGTVSPFTITELTPEQTYSIEIRGANDDGPGPWSTPKEFTMNPLAPSEAPAITDISVGLTTADITYTGVDRATSYEFEVTPVGGQATIHESSDNPFQVTGLTSGQDYFIRMRGKNVTGNGPWSDSSLFTTGELPQTAPVIESVDNIVNQLGVRVTRSDVDNTTGYHYRLNAGTPVDVGMNNPFDITQNIVSGESYNLEVRGYNEFGNGPWSDVTSFTVSDLAAGGNGIITFTGITTSSFVMNWGEATDSQYTHAQLTYHVYSSEISNIDTIAKAEANGTLETSQQGITSFEITGLQELETRFVNVVVENPGGFKGLYVMNEMTTEESEEVTQTVTIDSISEDSDGVHIGYTEIPEVNPITGQYEVLVTELDINDQTVSETVVVVGQDNPGQLTTLLEITKYNLRMRGANGPEKGPWGAVRSYTTMGTGAFSDPVAEWEVI